MTTNLMLSLIILAALLIIVGVAVLIQWRVRNKSSSVESSKFVDVPNGKALLVKDSRGNYSISYGGRIDSGSSYRQIDVNPITGNSLVDVSCNNGEILNGVEIHYSVRKELDTDDLNIESLIIDNSSLISSTELIIASSVKNYLQGKSILEIYEDKSLNENLTDYINLSQMGLELLSFSIDVVVNNRSKIEKLYAPPVEDIITESRVEQIRRQSEEEIQLAEINKEKEARLHKIALESLKENSSDQLARQTISNETALETEKMNIVRQAQLSNIRKGNQAQEAIKDEEARLKQADLEYKNNLRIAEMNSQESLKAAEYEKSVKLAEINGAKEVELAKIESTREINSQDSISKLEELESKKKLSLANLETSMETQKREFAIQEELQEDKKKKVLRDLELSVILPAEEEARKNKIAAESKAVIKEIDTESSIKSAESKLELKKKEAAVLAEIKKANDLNDMEIYEKLMSISSSNPSLAIQWKMIDKYERIAQIQGDSLTKMNLGQITINGSSDGSGLMNLINSLAPAFSSMKLPDPNSLALPSKKEAKKSGKDKIADEA